MSIVQDRLKIASRKEQDFTLLQIMAVYVEMERFTFFQILSTFGMKLRRSGFEIDDNDGGTDDRNLA